jgi:TRAP-type C4-dicarboxylate transport system permease large subunit
VLLVILLFLGMPIAFVMMFVGFTGIWALSSLDAALPKVAETVWGVANNYPYTIIPLFILMGSFAGSGGITRELYNTFDKWARRLPGGLGIATIGACAAFGAVSGSSVAAAAAMGNGPAEMAGSDTPQLAAVIARRTLSFLYPQPRFVSTACSRASIGTPHLGILPDSHVGVVHRLLIVLVA